LRAGRNLQRFEAVDRVDLHVRAERRLSDAQRMLGVDVVIATLKLRVLFDGEKNVQIARRSAVESRLAFARNAQPRAFVDTGRNLHRDLFLFAHAARAVARRTRILDHFPRAAALRTRTRNREESLRVTNLSASAAAAARHRLRTRFRAAAVARRAIRAARNIERHVFAEDRFLELERQVVAKIVAARRARTAATASAAEEIAEAEEVAENVAEVGELIRVEAAHAAEALMSEA